MACEEVEAWDFVADVVVVGRGGPGLAAALRAHDGGATVIVVDALGRSGSGRVRALTGVARAVVAAVPEAYDYLRGKGDAFEAGARVGVGLLERRARWQGVRFLGNYRPERLLRARGGAVCGLQAACGRAEAAGRRGFVTGGELAGATARVCVRAVRGVVLACGAAAGELVRCEGLCVGADMRCRDAYGELLAGLFACGAGEDAPWSCAVSAGYLAGRCAAGR